MEMVWRCDVTRNPVGTDTVKIGAPPCSCQGCRAAREIASLRHPFRGCDNMDWNYLASVIPDGGRGRFWKSVLGEMKAALSNGQLLSETQK
jgi:hypothetical protein